MGRFDCICFLFTFTSHKFTICILRCHRQILHDKCILHKIFYLENVGHMTQLYLPIYIFKIVLPTSKFKSHEHRTKYYNVYFYCIFFLSNHLKKMAEKI